jgi:hypothetical protein
MCEEYSAINVNKSRQLRPIKIDYSRVRNLEYIDLNNLTPLSFAQYQQFVIREASVTEEQARPVFEPNLRYLQSYSSLQFPKGKILILVNFDIYPFISGSVDQYIKDVAYEGYYATAYRVRGDSPVELRNFIKGKVPIVGIFMVGRLPVAWFEFVNQDDFNNSNSEFPCDLFYSDLNGLWLGSANDGKFGQHTSGFEPEIWIGRLWTPTENGNDVSLLNDYFSRNHKFRKGQFGYSDQALSFVDDDWIGFGDCAFDQMFKADNIEIVTDPASTDGNRYKAEIQQHRSWIQICAHSSSNGHSFRTPEGSEWVANSYLRDVNPANAFFYNLFACCNARFTEPEYIAGWYIFDKNMGCQCKGLSVVGSTKTGSMLLFENFYGPMGNGKSIGDAFKDWWTALGNTHDLCQRKWYYGMVLLGDPTINWFSGVVPTLTNPQDSDTFDHFPRRTYFRWDPICLKNVRYNIEIDAFGARACDKWAAETGLSWFVSNSLNINTFEHVFVGAQHGRWRVRARLGNITCPWSDWSYFNYIV